MRAVDCRTALDVGANVGNHTAYFSDWARRVYAFELNPPVFERLQAFVAGARLANVTAFPCGLSDRDDERTYYVFPGQAHLADVRAGPGAVAAGRVRVRRGDSIVAEAGIADIDVIKIDVEEHEFEVLNGLRATLARDRPVLFMEFKENSAAKFGGPAGTRGFPGGLSDIRDGQRSDVAAVQDGAAPRAVRRREILRSRRLRARTPDRGAWQGGLARGLTFGHRASRPASPFGASVTGANSST